MPYRDPEKRKEQAQRYRLQHRDELIEYDRRRYQRERDEQIEYSRNYRQKHKEELREKKQIYYQEKGREKKRQNELRKRRRALELISKNNSPMCLNCGCDDIRILEINHMNGGGTAERKNKIVISLVNDILSGRRKTDDLDIRCKVCNSLHYIELRYGKFPFVIGYKKREVGL